MKLETIPACNLTGAELKALSLLSFRKSKLHPHGGELRELLYDWADSSEAFVVRLSDDDGRILCWGLLRPYDGRANKELQLYTRRSERRKGYGRMVFDKAAELAKGRQSLIVKPHSNESIGFFNEVHYKPQNLPTLKRIAK